MKTAPFDPVKHLDNPEAIRAYVEEWNEQARMWEEEARAMRAEIEMLRKLSDAMREEIELQEAEIERLRTMLTDIIKNWQSGADAFLRSIYFARYTLEGK